jgi:hypothetical protein
MPIGSEENPNRSEDLDALVCSFLEELEVLNVQLAAPQPETVTAQAAPANTQIEAAAVPVFGDVKTPARYVRNAFICVGILALVLACRFYLAPARVATPTSPAPEAPAAKAPLRVEGLNDTALLLAGLPVLPDSPLYELSLSEPFEQHRKEMQFFWNRIRKENIPKIRQWREANLPGKLDKNPVLYPLSGADYLNAYAFFPHAREYLLVALEPPGEVPDMKLLTEKEQEDSLSAIRRVVRSLASVNYLQSKTMREELTHSSFHGVVPVLLLFASGLGHTVEQVRPVSIDEKGQLCFKAGESAPGKYHRVAGIDVPEAGVRGIQIQFVDGGDGNSKSIIYLQLELKDQILSDGKPEGRFLTNLKGRNAMLKSAVYLLHGSNYSKVRQFILESSDLILQDDSGIPYRYFQRPNWEEALFGVYTRPQPLGGLVNPPQQPLLAERYALGSHPLPFPYGYGVLWGQGQSNLMLFVKKSAP